MLDSKPGKPIGMTFTPGPIDHPTFGKLAEKEYTIPLFVLHGDFPFPSIATDPSILQAQLPALVKKYGSIWPDELDDVIEARIRDSTLHQAFINPLAGDSDDIFAPEQEPWIALGPFRLAIDDLMDQANYVGSIKYTDAVKIKSFCQDIFNGRYMSIDEVPNLITSTNHLREYLFNFYFVCNARIPNWSQRNSLFIQEIVNLTYAHVLLAVADEDDEFSIRSREFFQAYRPGALACLELLMFTNGITIPSNVTSNILLQRARVLIGLICGLTRDLLSIRRHIGLNKDQYSTVLWPVKNSGLTLQESVDTSVQTLAQYVTDLSGAIQRLRYEFASENALWEYFSLAKYMLDGQVYYYQHCCSSTDPAAASMYGDLKMKIVGISRKDNIAI